MPSLVEASNTYEPNNSTPIERVIGNLRGGFKTPGDANQANPINVIVSRINEDPGLVRAAEKACENKDVQKDCNHIIQELAKGNENPGIGSKFLDNGITEHRGKHGRRVLSRKPKKDVIEILAKSGKKRVTKTS